MDLQRWEQGTAELTTTNKSCSVVKCVWDGIYLSMSLSRKNSGLSVLIDVNESWAGGHQVHQRSKSTATYPGGAGESTYVNQVDSRFISGDCGQLRPGEGAPAVTAGW